MKKIVLCGGGTAGHVYPALAVAEKLGKYDLHFVGGNGMEKEILKKHKNITYHEIPTVKLERRLTPKNLLLPFKLLKCISASKKILKEIGPDIIFSKGGFVSVPVAIAGKRLHIPIVSHESDLSFGLANKIILKCCDTMCTTFKETANGNKKCVHTGQPIREKIYHGKRLLLFENDKPTILVLGGSLGAKFLNDIIFENLDILTKQFNIIHVSGKNNYQKIKHEGYKIVPYAENIEDFYATCDIAIARAGSGVINELLSLNIPMLLIPLSKKCSRGDQIENAKNFVKNGYAQMIEEESFTFNSFIKKIDFLLKNKEKYKKKMAKTSKNHASDAIFKILEEKMC
ncbi:MAG: undecaprenyldiphospho-muramoylpentapeptide beta-N-acetylglucosaminyltransferase [Clostridia bacterium]|nr:undecaprenyldiphospho-muramoylpentapeptide beta-N-acetylglucosaminyltransferase [Clostridia bacterium]